MRDDEPLTFPVKHRYLAGELKHHFLRKDGTLAEQRKPLDKHSDKRRLSYQLLSDDAGPAFVSIWLTEEPATRIQFVPAFLALAWSAPQVLRRDAGPMGYPDVLMVPAIVVDKQVEEELAVMRRELGFSVEFPGSGFDAGVHLVTKIGRSLKSMRWMDGAEGVDFSIPDNMRRLSYFAALEVSLPRTTPTQADMDALLHTGRRPVYRRHPVPPSWLDTTAKRYGLSLEELQGMCWPYFSDKP